MIPSYIRTLSSVSSIPLSISRSVISCVGRLLFIFIAILIVILCAYIWNFSLYVDDKIKQKVKDDE